MKKLVAMLLTLSLCVSVPVTAFATENDTDDTTLKTVSELLENNPTTEVITVSEGEIITQMISDGTLTYEELNADLLELSTFSVKDLEEMGYETAQINQIKNYTEDIDAFSYLYESREVTPATLTFQYGIAGTNNSKKTVAVAYDVRWSKRPTSRYSDTIAIGWVATNADSVILATKVDSASGSIVYGKDTSSEVEVVDMPPTIYSTYLKVNFAVGDDTVIAKYAKSISGIVYVSTQADSYNMESFMLTIGYAHAVKSVELYFDGVSISLE